MKTVYLIVTGNIITGTQIHGPELTAGLAHDYAIRELRLNEYIVVPVEIKSRIDFEKKQNLYAVVLGSSLMSDHAIVSIHKSRTTARKQTVSVYTPENVNIVKFVCSGFSSFKKV